MDRQKLINEIRKRPALWDLQSSEHKSLINVSEMWRDVSINMGLNVTVDECKRKWKNLRDAYRVEVKHVEMRIARDLMLGVYDPNYEHKRKWTYYEAMSFIKDIKRPRRNIISSHKKNNKVFNDRCHPLHFAKLNHEIKLNADKNLLLNDYINDLYGEELLDETQGSQETETSQPLIPPASNKRNTENSASSNSKCFKGSPDQIYFLNHLKKKEQIPSKSSSFDISHSSNIAFIGDSDYNFLVSFLQQMKEMNEVQNLQFRAKISELMYKIMLNSATKNTISDSATLP